MSLIDPVPVELQFLFESLGDTRKFGLAAFLAKEGPKRHDQVLTYMRCQFLEKDITVIEGYLDELQIREIVEYSKETELYSATPYWEDMYYAIAGAHVHHKYANSDILRKRSLEDKFDDQIAWVNSLVSELKTMCQRERTYDVDQALRKTGTKISNARIIESTKEVNPYGEQPVLEFFGSYLEFDRLGPYWFYWDIEEAKRAHEYLGNWVKRAEKMVTNTRRMKWLKAHIEALELKMDDPEGLKKGYTDEAYRRDHKDLEIWKDELKALEIEQEALRGGHIHG